MEDYPPLQYPGEPDVAAEIRLRAELKVLRTLATMVGRLELMRRSFYANWPGVYEATEILAPPDHKAILEEHERIRPLIKGRLLEVESYFVEKGWSLPKWSRPEWLLR